MSAPHYFGYTGPRPNNAPAPPQHYHHEVVHVQRLRSQSYSGSGFSITNRSLIHRAWPAPPPLSLLAQPIPIHVHPVSYVPVPVPVFPPPPLPRGQAQGYIAQTRAPPAQIPWQPLYNPSMPPTIPASNPNPFTGPSPQAAVPTRSQHSHHNHDELDDYKKDENETMHGIWSASRIGVKAPNNDQGYYRYRSLPDLSTFHVDRTIQYPDDRNRNTNCPADPLAAKRLFYLWDEEYVEQNDLLDSRGTQVRCILCNKVVRLGNVPYALEGWINHWNTCEMIQKAWDLEDPHTIQYYQDLGVDLEELERKGVI
ncbi:hypothetical protein VKT23_007998 [Stygiomarasmius scandens]|uniref:Uncharacterized protein n=1 Tax=Marasmiellus scandens TaxID=2682957 RepID=A0ABR1JLJ3_9AGAR